MLSQESVCLKLVKAICFQHIFGLKKSVLKHIFVAKESVFNRIFTLIGLPKAEFHLQGSVPAEFHLKQFVLSRILPQNESKEIVVSIF